MLIQRPEYPRELEVWWLETARDALDVKFTSDAMKILAPDIGKLSDGFTTERQAGFGDYAADERAQLAYGLFFFPQTFVRTLFQFDEIVNRCGWKPAPGRPVRIVDLGSGSGSAGFALASRLVKEGDAEVTAVENSATALSLARTLARKQWPRVVFKERCGSLLEFGGDAAAEFDLIVASFSLNECFHDKPEAEFDAWVDRALSRLSDGGLLLISEPAMKVTSERLERLRNRVAASGRQTILAPCLHHRTCPLLAAGGGNFCHEVRWWKPTRSMQSLNSKLFRTLQFLKYSFVAIANRPLLAVEGTAESARLVSPMMSLKGRAQCDGCAADGALRRYEVLTRAFPTPEKHAFLKTERGDVVRWDRLSLLGDQVTHRAESAGRTCGFD